MGVVRRVRAWRRYRWMLRRLAELDRKDAAGGQRVHSPRGRGLSKGEVIFLLSVPALAGVLYLLVNAFPSLLGTHYWQQGLSPARPPSSAATGPFAFEATMPSGRPVSYDRCHPIHYVINPAGMPKQGIELINDAVQTISAASGLKFVDDGLTQERPDPNRQPSPSTYSHHWVPVLIAWVNHAEYPGIERDIDGIGGSTEIIPAGPESAHYVTGQVVLSRDNLTEMLSGRNGYVEARAIVEHELGHVVGLAHVHDPDELMNPEYIGLTGLGPGDRQGLAQLGSGPCLPDF